MNRAKVAGCPYCKREPEVKGAFGGGFTVRCQDKLDHNVSVYALTGEEAAKKWQKAFTKASQPGHAGRKVRT